MTGRFASRPSKYDCFRFWASDCRIEVVPDQFPRAGAIVNGESYTLFPRFRKPTRRTQQETRRSDKFSFCAAARLDGKANGRKAGSRTSRHHKTKSYCDARGVPDVREDFPIAPDEFRNRRMGDQDHVRPPRLQPALPQATNSMQKNPRSIQSSNGCSRTYSHLAVTSNRSRL